MKFSFTKNPESDFYEESKSCGKGRKIASAVPTSWKEATVTPFFTKDDPSEVSNYRSISLLNTIGKVFEKLVLKHVYNFFSSSRVLSSLQSGFVPGGSTVNQLMSTYDVFFVKL